MFRLRSVFVAIVLASAAAVGAQDPDHPYNTKSNALLIEGWLQSGDPRLVAFGANFAAENDDDGLVTLLEQAAARWNPYPQPSVDQSLAMMEILHALIAHKTQVPIESLAAVARSFPDQALILASFLPPDEAAPMLEKWYENEDEPGSPESKMFALHRRLLVRVAAMMLAKAPPPGFAAHVLEDSEQHLTVCVIDRGASAPNFCEGSNAPARRCDDEIEGPPKGNWPPLYRYNLEEDSSGGDADGEVVTEGGDSITWRRAPANWQLSGCYAPRPLNAETRVRLLAEMLRTPDGRMPWQPHKGIALPWENTDKFVLEFTSLVSFAEAQLRGTVQALYAKGMLTRSEAGRVRPKLRLEVVDLRNPAQPPLEKLPRIALHDARTAYVDR